jgi:hypothetical protein
MSRSDAPVIAARVLLLHDLSDDAILGYLARTWALDERHCDAALEAARFLIRQETAARERADCY